MKENKSCVKIRSAVSEDIDILCAMLEELFTIEDDFTTDTSKQRAGLDILINGNTESIIFIAQSGSEIAGMINLQKIVSTAAGGYSVLLEDLFVKAEYRSIGIGKMLIDRALLWAKSEGALRIQLAADIRNKVALSFYSNSGFNISNMVLYYRTI